MVLAPHVLRLPFVWKNASRRIRSEKGENAETKENRQTRPNNNRLVIKQSQGHLVPSQGL